MTDPKPSEAAPICVTCGRQSYERCDHAKQPSEAAKQTTRDARIDIVAELWGALDPDLMGEMDSEFALQAFAAIDRRIDQAIHSAVQAEREAKAAMFDRFKALIGIAKDERSFVDLWFEVEEENTRLRKALDAAVAARGGDT